MQAFVIQQHQQVCSRWKVWMKIVLIVWEKRIFFGQLLIILKTFREIRRSNTVTFGAQEHEILFILYFMS